MKWEYGVEVMRLTTISDLVIAVHFGQADCSRVFDSSQVFPQALLRSSRHFPLLTQDPSQHNSQQRSESNCPQITVFISKKPSNSHKNTNHESNLILYD